jgi:hypothetical protein
LCLLTTLFFSATRVRIQHRPKTATDCRQRGIAVLAIENAVVFEEASAAFRFNPATPTGSRHYGCASINESRFEASRALPLAAVQAAATAATTMADVNKGLFQHYLRTRESLRKRARAPGSRSIPVKGGEEDGAVDGRAEVRGVLAQPAHLAVEVAVNVVPRIMTGGVWQDKEIRASRGELQRSCGKAKSAPAVHDRNAAGQAVRTIAHDGKPPCCRGNSSDDCISYQKLTGLLVLDTASAVHASVQQSGLPASRRAMQLHAAEAVTTTSAVADGDKAEAAAAAIAIAEVAAASAAADPAACDIAVGPLALQRRWADPAQLPPPPASDDADAALAWAVRCLGGNRTAREVRARGFAANGGLVGRCIDVFLPLLLQWVSAEVHSIVRGTAHIRLWCAAQCLVLCRACKQRFSDICGCIISAKLGDCLDLILEAQPLHVGGV